MFEEFEENIKRCTEILQNTVHTQREIMDTLAVFIHSLAGMGLTSDQIIQFMKDVDRVMVKEWLDKVESEEE